MGSVLSGFFQTGSRLLSAGSSSRVSEHTRRILVSVFEALRNDPRASPQGLDTLLSQIPKGDNILLVTDEEGFNLLQVVAGRGNAEFARWAVSRGCDANRGACSLPLHIACLKGCEEIVETLLKHGARVDTEVRMCWPGPHNQSCEQRGANAEGVADRSSDKLQSAIFYAIDGDHVEILELLMQQGEDNWLPWQQKQPLLHLACERGAWNCVKFLVSERPLEINACHDEYYPIHQAALHDIKFLELLLQCGADARVRTATQQMTVLHVVFLLGKKSADETLSMVKMLLDHGLRELINEADSLGNTALHALVVRYALEEARYGYDHAPPPWNRWDMLHIMRHLIQAGAGPSLNRPGNGALACVLRHVRDWEFRYDLLHMLLQRGADPNLAGRDGSVPLMVCLVPLINKNPPHYPTHAAEVFHLNCVRLLCRHGADPNRASRSTLTPLHVLVFTAGEYVTLGREHKARAFAFLRQLLVVLLRHGLDPDARFSQRTSHALLALMDAVQNARTASDLEHVYELTRALLQHGADPNVNICTTEPMICHSQGSVFLKKPANRVLYFYVQLLLQKQELLLDARRRHEKLIWLYYFAMEHRQLYGCLKILNAQAALVPMRHAVGTLLRRLYTQPRSLKQIARVSIYSAVRRRSAQSVAALPLPVPLKDYIVNWDP